MHRPGGSCSPAASSSSIRRSRTMRPDGSASSRARRASPCCASPCAGRCESSAANSSWDAPSRRRSQRSAREPEVALCSFDMLGEGARTLADAERYLASYEHAIDVIGARRAAATARTSARASRSSSPRSSRATRCCRTRRVMERLVPKTLELARRAAAARHSAHDRCRGGGPPRPVARRDRGARRAMPRRATGRASGSRCRPIEARAGRDRLGRGAGAREPAGAWPCASSRAPTGTARSSVARSAG